jgi:hypothetical protein
LRRGRGGLEVDIFEVMDSSDPIFQSAFYKKFNPSGNPTLHDVCVTPTEAILPATVVLTNLLKIPMVEEGKRRIGSR